MNKLLVAFLSSIIYGLLSDQTSAHLGAHCEIKAGSGIGNVSGNITFHEMDNKVSINISLIGFPNTTNSSKHGFHVHQSGNLSDYCNAALGHFNPYNATHGNISDPHNQRHVGDLGNIIVKPDGTVDTEITDDYISLNSSSLNYIIGKAIVVHAKEDDLGRGGDVTSNTTGNAGGRLGCCKIINDHDMTGMSTTTGTSTTTKSSAICKRSQSLPALLLISVLVLVSLLAESVKL